mgnify:CR=1 FL=1
MTRHARQPRRSPLTVALVTLLLAVACASAAAVALRPWDEGVTADLTSVPTPTPDAVTPSPTPSPTPDPDAEFTIVAAGDVLTHQPVVSSATRGGTIDFAPLLEPLAPWVQGADLALCHLEVPVAPAGSRPSGYPVFGAPVEVVAGLAAQGWDGCSTASNHSVDRGFAGVVATLDALDAAGLGHVGTARSQVEAMAPQVYTLERAGQTITVAHLAATYGTNGMPVEPDKPWSVTRIDVPTLVEQARAARTAGADLVVASVHCCVEYQTEPTAEQAQIAQEIADSGAVDLYIGHHAHVPQPVVRLEGGPDGTGMWVAYGLGNFLSNQDAACCSPKTDSGLLLTAHVSSPGAFAAEGREAGPVRVTGVEWTAITVDRKGGHRVHALPEIAGGTGSLGAGEVAARLGRVVDAAGSAAPQRTEPLTPTGGAPVVVPRPGGTAATP